jgi:hypothetical protein
LANFIGECVIDVKKHHITERLDREFREVKRKPVRTGKGGNVDRQIRTETKA